MDLFILWRFEFPCVIQKTYKLKCVILLRHRYKPATQWGSYWKQIIWLHGCAQLTTSILIPGQCVDLLSLTYTIKQIFWNYRKAESHFLGVKNGHQAKARHFLKVKKAFRLWGTRTCRKCNSQWTCGSGRRQEPEEIFHILEMGNSGRIKSIIPLGFQVPTTD